MPRMREFTFNNGKEDKIIEAMSYKKAVKSYQSSANRKEDGDTVNVYWLSKKGKEESLVQKLPLGRKVRQAEIIEAKKAALKAAKEAGR
jgi:hypothetical protein|tara:strand:- start:58133 stop:58399 length:267 start_codon:yes stop_codon:yes gene_type:complete